MSILPFSSGEAREGGGVSGAGEGHSLGAMDGLWNQPGRGVSGPVPCTRCGTPQPQASRLESEDDPPPWVGKLTNLRAFCSTAWDADPILLLLRTLSLCQASLIFRGNLC